MKHEESCFTNRIANNIAYQFWLPKQNTQRLKGIIVISHGLAEHGGRYQHVALYFVSLGYGVYAIDHLGHGKSSGTPCFAKSMDDYVECLEDLIQIVKKTHGDIPVFLLGHSMGGLIASLYLLDHQDELKGAILSAPLIASHSKPTRIQTFLVKFLARFFPKVGVLQLDPRLVSRDPDVIQNYIEDPLVYSGKVTAKLSIALGAGMAKIHRLALNIKLPIIILQGAEDKLVKPEGAKVLFNKISSTDKSLEYFDNCYHEILNEPEQNEVLSSISNWLEQRL